MCTRVFPGTIVNLFESSFTSLVVSFFYKINLPLNRLFTSFFGR